MDPTTRSSSIETTRSLSGNRRAAQIGGIHALRFSRTGASAAIPGSWFTDVGRSGGLVMDLMIHDLDAARWLAGDVTTVYASQEPANRNGRLPPIVSAHVALTHESGTISQLHGTWGALGDCPSVPPST